MDNAEFRERVKATLAREHVKRGFFARLSGIEEHRLSKLLNGSLVLSAESVRRMTVALRFIEMVAREAAPLPVCFDHYERIEPTWDEFLRNLRAGQSGKGAAAG
jgi:hypothetical protein